MVGKISLTALTLVSLSLSADLLARKRFRAPQAISSDTISTGGIKVINNINEYVALCTKHDCPTIIIFNSTDCTACDLMHPSMKSAAEKYKDKAKFYTINAKGEEFKELSKKMKDNGMPEIKAYPTTHFLKPGKKVRAERGSMGAQEIDTIVQKLVSEETKS